MNSLVGDVGYLLAGLLFGFLFLYQSSKKFKPNEEYVSTSACFFTSLWSWLCLVSAHASPVLYLLVQAAEIAKSIAIYLMLFSFLGLVKDPRVLFKKSRGMAALLLIVIASAIPLVLLLFSYFGIVVAVQQENVEFPGVPYKENGYVTWMLVLSITGLVLLEQILRNVRLNYRWHLKYLCIGLGITFCYDTYMYTAAMLVQGEENLLWAFRGYLYAVSAVFIGITLIRTRLEPVQLHFSRKIVFHSSMMLLAGIYLLMMSAAGFLLKQFSSSWGQIQQAIFWITATVALVVVISSVKFRSYLRYYVTRNFFSTKYDYREEWTRISKTLALNNIDNSLPERAVMALAECIDSSGGGIWLSRDSTIYEQVAHVDFGWINDANVGEDSSFIRFLQAQKWIIELTNNEEIHEDIRYPKWLVQLKKVWLVIPLLMDETLLGFILLKHSRVPRRLNWEDLDLLKAAASQASSYLGLMLATEALSEAKQFSAFSQMSAFVVHDLKTLNSQLSLMIANAPKHKTNPSFVDDMIETSAHVVNKLNALLGHLKNANNKTQSVGERVDLLLLLSEVTESKRHSKVSVEIKNDGSTNYIYAKADELRAAFGHLIQNAIDATTENGKVEVLVFRKEESVLIIIRDNGVGMTEDFIRSKLFRPFESTKGLTGMGIGAFQSREFIRRLGGDITVQSEVGIGSRFHVTIPLLL